MRILIVGEYSGFAKNLSAGFNKLGHEAVIVGYGDGWKKIDVGKNGHLLDYFRNYRICNISLRRSWKLRCAFHFYKVKELRKMYEKYFDIILIMNYEFIRLNYEKWYPYFSIEDLMQMLVNRGKIYLSACGEDYATFLYASKLRYTYFTNIKNDRYLKKRLMRIFKTVCKYINGVVPVMYEYAGGYRDIAEKYSLKVCNTIPLPVDSTNIQIHNILSDKIVVFHGKSRLCKGSNLIVQALEQLKEKYPDQLEVVVGGGIPLNEYLKVMQRTNIIIDQCWSYSYGMNAIYAMAMGKVVLSGNEPECGLEFKRTDIPIVNILPNVEDIVTKLEYFIIHPEKIQKVGEESKKFVRKFHDAKVVAKQYVDLFITSLEFNNNSL